MGDRSCLLLFVGIAACFYGGDGCQMESVSNWLLTQDGQILDTYRGTFWNSSTTNIEEITGVTAGGGVNSALYLNVQLENGYFTITTSDNYAQYEENETADNMSFTVNFRCTGGGTNLLTFSIRVIDTNNNPPTFIPTNQFEFTITPPLPPGFQITGCIGEDLVVRDIDLTTSRIDFTIEDNPFFEIIYDGRSTADAKEFIAVLKTKDLIRALPEDIELTISATDVDATDDPSITSYATITIRADEAFRFPEEPIFSQPFYIAMYTESEIVMEEIISLKQGFDEEVTFSLEGEESNNFRLVLDGNQISFIVDTPLTSEILKTGQIILVVRAEREYTSGTSTTIIVQLPEERTTVLGFDSFSYFGSIDSDIITLDTITLSEGYSQNVSFALLGEMAHYFTVSSDGPIVTVILLNAVPEELIPENQMTALKLQASAPDSISASTTIVLEFIQNKSLLGFDRFSYLGSIDSNILNLEPITLSEGYSSNVSFVLLGEMAHYFTLSSNGPIVTVLLLNTVPEELIPENRIIALVLQASAPQSISASAAIVLDVQDESPPILEQVTFSEAFYTGHYTQVEGLSFENAMTLIEGYNENTTFALEGESSQYFETTISDNSVLLRVTTTIPVDVLQNNQQLIFTIRADRQDAITARATIVIALLDDFTEDVVILGFNQAVYVGSIDNDVASLETITLSEGYSQTVSFALLGEMAQYFSLSSDGPVVTVILSNPMPEESIPENGRIILVIQASSPESISASAAIVLDVQDESPPILEQVTFSEAFYTGLYTQVEGLSFETAMTLIEGYNENTTFALEGESSQYFETTISDNLVQLRVTTTIPVDVLQNNQQLIFTIRADRQDAITARATIVIALLDDFTEDVVILGFNQVVYVGSIDNDVASLETITLSEGYSQNVSFVLLGEMAQYFSLSSDGPVVTVILSNPMPEESIPENGRIILEIQASSPESISASAGIVFDIQDESSPAVEQMTFSEPYYTGHYTQAEGLSFENVMTLMEGYNENTTFALEGESSQYFEPIVADNSVLLRVTTTIPAAVLLNNRQLVFTIRAERPDTTTARATIVIALLDEFNEHAVILGFNQVVYIGSIDNEIASLETITLSEGYSQTVSFVLLGEMAQYFSLSSDGPVVTVILSNPMPEESIPENGRIILVIQASSPESISASAGIVFDIQDESSPAVEQMTFSEPYYTGHYTQAEGLSFENVMTLMEGYNENTTFALEGESSQYFEPIVADNSVLLRVTTTIPAAVLLNNRQLVFTIRAERPDATTARATIVIALLDEFNEHAVILGFNQVVYIGSIDNDVASLETITLSEGYSQTVSFALLGEMAQYFSLSSDGPVVTVILSNPMPEESIPENGRIILVIQASSPESISAGAGIVFDIQDESSPAVEQMTFSEPYYTGHYTQAEGLSFENVMTLMEGYNENTTFALEGESSQYFEPIVSDNSVLLRVTTTIPAAVLLNNRQLVFTIRAERPDATTARATIVIALLDEFNEHAVILGFNQVVYIGSIDNDVASLETITLSEGYSQTVSFALLGEMAQYFSLSSDGPVVTVILSNPMPEESIPENGRIILVIQASSPESISASAGIVFDIQDESSPAVEQMTFSEPYYTGHYTQAEGLSFENVMTLMEGYNENTTFALEGESSQYFEPIVADNSVLLRVTTTIPAAVLLNNRQLVFTIRAERPDATTARATIVIALLDEFNEHAVILGFNQVVYIGSIDNDVASLETITLSEGYSQTVSFALLGEMAQYFSLSSDGPVVTVILSNPMPEESIPENGRIILEIQASSPESISASAGIVFDIQDESSPAVEQMTFSEPYYTGHYTQAEGLSFENVMTLMEGYNENTTFALEGESSQYFEPIVADNSVLLRVTTTIPAAVLLNNRQLVFTIRAERPDATTARATIVIALLDEFNEHAVILGFNQVVYIGSIDNDVASLETITLSEGYSQTVSFALLGEMAQYFSLSSDGPVVTVILSNPMPEESIPENGRIILEIQASSPESISASAGIVFDIQDESSPAVEQMTFSEPYYTGHYTQAEGLSFENVMTLMEGYNENTTFALEGESSQYFEPIVADNSVLLRVTTTIPAAVLLNNRQLVFTIRAERPDTTTARATIVIALLDEFNEHAVILGFNQVVYIGSIDNEIASLETITLSEGYSQTVSFVLLGEMAQYFSLSSDGPVVTVILSNPMPEESIPENGRIILVIQASSPESISASAGIVFDIQDESSPAVEQMTFSEPYYTGHYTQAEGLSFENVMTLMEGYNENTTFALEGESSQYFEPIVADNSVLLRVTTTIPAAVLLNNRQLVFTIRAERPDATTARATIVIALLDEFNEHAVILGFNQVVYIGSIDNDVASLETITLSEGYSQTVSFALLGEMAQYFSLSSDGPVVTVILSNPMPEESIPENGRIILEIQASSPESISASAGIVFDIRDESSPAVEQMTFSEPYYTGHYTQAEGLSFENVMTLMEGYNENTTFALEGESSQYFEPIVADNSVLLRVTTTIPAAVLLNNRQLVFTIRAERPDATTARATIVIALLDEFNEHAVILGFNQVVYIGSIDNDVASLETITLSEGYSQTVSFVLLGEMAQYFSLSSDGPVVTVILSNPMPEESIPENGRIILVIQASSPESISASAGIVFDIQDESSPAVEQMTFSEPYYTGHYTQAEGLSFENVMTLMEGYNENTTFALEGESSQYFEPIVADNSVLLRVTTTIPAAVLLNNRQLVFTIRAERPDATTARATIVIALLDEFNEHAVILGFNQVVYIGSIDNDVASLETITLSEGYSQTVSFALLGEMAQYFSLSSDGPVVTVILSNPMPEESIPENGRIILEIQASSPESISASAGIVFDIQDESSPAVEQMTFSEPYYTGHYTQAEGLSFENVMTLMEGYNENTTFALEGESSQYFEPIVSDNSVLLRVTTTIPAAVLLNNRQLVFTIRAERPDATTARATIVIALLDEFNEHAVILGFNQVVYIGSIDNDVASLETITLSEGYSQTVSFALLGEMAHYFYLSSDGPVVTVILSNPMPEESIPENGRIILVIQASSPESISASAGIVFDIQDESSPAVEQMTFSELYYTGHYTQAEGLSFENVMTLMEGYNENTTFALEGESSQYFEPIVSDNSVLLRVTTTIPAAVLLNNRQLVFTIRADRPDATTARATIVIALLDEFNEHAVILGFNQVVYMGSIDDDVANLETITLSEGYSQNVSFVLFGDFSEYFVLFSDSSVVTVTLMRPISELAIPDNDIIVLELQASAFEAISAHAVIVLKVVRDKTQEMIFSEPYYSGYYSFEEGLQFEYSMNLLQGYDETVYFSLEGEHSHLFQIQISGNSVSLILQSVISSEIFENNTKLVLFIVAQKIDSTARVPIVISFINGTVCSSVSFEKVIFEGVIQSGEIRHETIIITGYDGFNVQIVGEYSDLFSSSIIDGVVTVEGVGPVILAADISYVILELRVGSASAVLLLDVFYSENQVLPSVTFGSSSYILRLDISQTGLVGRVQAAADNGEDITYSLDFDDAHLLQRMSINEEGELFLSAPINSGAYSFQVIATTVFSGATATATVHLTVELITTCGEDDFVLPPLQILDRDEESSYTIITFNQTEFEGCRYSLNNRWPINQQWLYVDENGLHTTPIDREHESIAFMALSQIQIELTLECNSDTIRTKRSVDTGIDQLEHLGPYDYGSNKWILTDSIMHNSRRSLINLIVNDINDNYPIFVGKENEPVVIGYPIAEVAERILPRSLVEVKATDADVGENAALVYWTTEDSLTVSPITGFVHVMDNARLDGDFSFTINATDRNGQGLTGSLDLLVKQINTNHIAVVTIKNAFLDDEYDILTNLSSALGYEVKGLRTTVISEAKIDEVNLRKTREAVISSGASVQIYIYGLVEREPVNVERLIGDIETSTMIDTGVIASTVSLDNHLESLDMCSLPVRDTGLLVSTIVLAVLLFILIVAIAVWFFLKWWKERNYDQFSEQNSLASDTDSLKPTPIQENVPKPRINIEELKRSERRLQEMLDTPLADVSTAPTSLLGTEKVSESKVNIPDLPIVIQSIDKLKDVDDSEDDDEFGERRKAKRKSVVTFNENVEKIIHVEDPPDDPEYEVYKL